MLKEIKQIINNKCPKCGEGKVFKDKNIFLSIRNPEMNLECSVCKNKYTKEPGFFIGAMYVSYGLGVAEGLITYVIASLFFEKSLDLRVIPIIAIVILLLTFTNIRLSRIIWLYMFKNVK